MEVIWHGGMKDTYLCVPPAEVRSFAHIPAMTLLERPPYHDWSRERAQALTLLETKPRWRIRDLRCLLGLTPPVMSGIVQRLRRDRIVRSVGHGYISLRRKAA